MKVKLEKHYQSLLTSLGWAGVILCAAVLIPTAYKATKTPHPFTYGEGIMMWGTKQIENKKWPYGDISETPSRYSTYGPATYTLTAIFAQAFQKDNPLRHAQAGRTLTMLSWILAGIILGLACKNTPLGTCATAMCLLAPTANTDFFWSFRMDGLLFLSEAILALTMIRGKQKTLQYAVPSLICLITLIKPPSALDIIPITMASLALRTGTPKENLKMLFKPLITGCIIAPTTFFGLDILTNFKMSNNILWTQTLSGIITEGSYIYNISMWGRTASLTTLLLGALAIGCLAKQEEKKAGWLLLSITTSITLAILTCLKAGADVNYILPSLLPIILAISKLLSSAPQLGAIAVLLMLPELTSKPIINEKFETYLPLETSQESFEKIKTAHNQENFLSEDIFYSVAANQTPLVTDIFQTTLYYQSHMAQPKSIHDSFQEAWGSLRLIKFLFGTEPNILEANNEKIVVTGKDNVEREIPIEPLNNDSEQWGPHLLVKKSKTLEEALKNGTWTPKKNDETFLTRSISSTFPTLLPLYLASLLLILKKPHET